MTIWLKSTIIVLVLCSLYISSSAQNSDTLYYFRDGRDSTLLGVRNAAGKTVIAAKFPVFLDMDLETPIHGTCIEIPGLSGKVETKRDIPAIAAGEVYNRNGKFLYYPQFFDNGSDYFREGLRRYVDHQKIGFVNTEGEKATPARWDFATPFNYGYAQVYTGGWKRQFDKGGEHWWVTSTSPEASVYVIDKNGVRVSPLAQKKDSCDYILDGKIYPYPYMYSVKEKAIRDTLNHLDILNELYRLSDAANLLTDTIELQFEITIKPTANFPYYTLQGFQKQQHIDEMTFLIDKAGKKIYHVADGQDQEAIIPLQKWMEAQLSDAKSYLLDHPDIAGSFDVDKALTGWHLKP